MMPTMKILEIVKVAEEISKDNVIITIYELILK